MSTEHFTPGPVEMTQPLLEHVEHQRQLIARLLAEASAERKEFDIMVPFGGNTDVSGNAKIMAYESPQGFGFSVHRLSINAINPTTGLPYTPAAPYTSGYIVIHRGEVGLNSLVDFAPTSPGGNVFPQVSTDGEDQGALYRGERVWVVINSGPVLSQVGGLIRAKLFRLGPNLRD